MNLIEISNKFPTELEAVQYFERLRWKGKKLICVLCGQEWGVQNPFTNRCENEKCSGICTWGYEPNKPESFFVDENGKWHLKPLQHKAINRRSWFIATVKRRFNGAFFI